MAGLPIRYNWETTPPPSRILPSGRKRVAYTGTCVYYNVHAAAAAAGCHGDFAGTPLGFRCVFNRNVLCTRNVVYYSPAAAAAAVHRCVCVADRRGVLSRARTPVRRCRPAAAAVRVSSRHTRIASCRHRVESNIGGDNVEMKSSARNLTT